MCSFLSVYVSAMHALPIWLHLPFSCVLMYFENYLIPQRESDNLLQLFNRGNLIFVIPLCLTFS